MIEQSDWSYVEQFAVGLADGEPLLGLLAQVRRPLLQALRHRTISRPMHIEREETRKSPRTKQSKRTRAGTQQIGLAHSPRCTHGDSQCGAHADATGKDTSRQNEEEVGKRSREDNAPPAARRCWPRARCSSRAASRRSPPPAACPVNQDNAKSHQKPAWGSHSDRSPTGQHTIGAGSASQRAQLSRPRSNRESHLRIARHWGNSMRATNVQQGKGCENSDGCFETGH